MDCLCQDRQDEHAQEEDHDHMHGEAEVRAGDTKEIPLRVQLKFKYDIIPDTGWRIYYALGDGQCMRKGLLGCLEKLREAQFTVTIRVDFF